MLRRRQSGSPANTGGPAPPKGWAAPTATRRRTARGWRKALGIVLLAAVLLAFGCTSTITPPPDPQEPVDVFLIQDARHLGLLLPRSPGVFVEYGYGDWDWYAKLHDCWYHVFDTVLWPTQGTLGRREVRTPDGEGVSQILSWTQVQPIPVPAAAARDLLASLDAQFARHQQEELYNATYGMTFVPHDDGFWCCYNCNDAVTDWLRALGCSVSWVPLRLGLALAEP